MTNRDWDKIMAKIDAQIGADESDELPRPEQLRPPRPDSERPATIAPARPPARGSSVGAFLRLGLAGALAVGMLLWPFDARCGFGLAMYLASVAVLVFAGGWSALWTWRHRTPRAHVIALVIVLWGIVLGATEILPRMGYGPASIDRPRIWTCG